MASKVTFKKQPRLTGRMGVGHPYQIVDCKIKNRPSGYWMPQRGKPKITNGLYA